MRTSLRYCMSLRERHTYLRHNNPREPRTIFSLRIRAQSACLKVIGARARDGFIICVT